MPANRNTSTKPVANITTATQKARTVIEDLQTRLKDVSRPIASSSPGAAQTKERASERLESEEELERQLEEYFARASGPWDRGNGAAGASKTQILDELRNRVIDGVVERILREWAGGRHGLTASGVGNEVMERLIERVLQEIQTPPSHPKASLPS